MVFGKDMLSSVGPNPSGLGNWISALMRVFFRVCGTPPGDEMRRVKDTGDGLRGESDGFSEKTIIGVVICGVY